MTAGPAPRPTWAEVDLAAVAHNFITLDALLRREARPGAGRGPRLIPVVKADAYGHGAAAVSRALVAAGADILAVALVEEGAALRGAGIQAEILVLEGAWEGQEDGLAAHGLTAAAHTPEGILRLDGAARRRGEPLRVHAKVDTGMARLGVPWQKPEPFLDALAGARHLDLSGTFTHLACAEEEDRSYTEEQIRRFKRVLEVFRARGLDPGEIHVANSAGLIHWPSLRAWSARPGIALYGYPPAPSRCPLDLRPALALKSRIGRLHDLAPGDSVGYNRRFIAPRPMRAATIPIGYADGCRRGLTDKGRVIIRDRYAGLLGTISMDMIVADVTAIEDAAVGDEVTLLGSSPRCRVDAADWAEALGTIPYEVLCGIGPRVPRTYGRRDADVRRSPSH